MFRFSLSTDDRENAYWKADMNMAAANKISPQPNTNRVNPSLRELFVGFLMLSLSSFGGTLPVAYRILVDQRQWIKSDEFLDFLTLSHFLPGSNIVNMAVLVGSRFHQGRGALVATLGLVLVPMFIMMGLAYVYTLYQGALIFKNILAGVTPVAAGLMVAMVVQMGLPVFKASWPFSKADPLPPVLFMGAAFVMVGLLKVSLVTSLLTLAPLSVFCAWWRSRREAV